MKQLVRRFLSTMLSRYDAEIARNRQEVDALYKLLYNRVHDLDEALPLASAQTKETFGFQWDKLQDGEAMLSDKWFKENLTSIVSERELLISKEWFKGKDVIDCGSGGGRWSYGLAQLGANITAVDVNESAIDATREVLKGMNVRQEFIITPLEHLSEHIAGKKYDLAWSWGVLHHCGSFNTSFQEVMESVKDGGFIYLYLYGRESITYEEDINLFKSRVYYNTLNTWKEKEQFLLDISNGDKTKLHQNHDMYSPLLNRRLDVDHVKSMLEANGFTDVTRTVDSSELHIRAVKGTIKPADKAMLLHPADNKAWYLKYNTN